MRQYSLVIIDFYVANILFPPTSCKLIAATLYYTYTGEFGVVYKGLLKRDSFNETVAVKTLKGNEFSHDVTTHACIVYRRMMTL